MLFFPIFTHWNPFPFDHFHFKTFNESDVAMYSFDVTMQWLQNNRPPKIDVERTLARPVDLERHGFGVSECCYFFDWGGKWRKILIEGGKLQKIIRAENCWLRILLSTAFCFVCKQTRFYLSLLTLPVNIFKHNDGVLTEGFWDRKFNFWNIPHFCFWKLAVLSRPRVFEFQENKFTFL